MTVATPFADSLNLDPVTGTGGGNLYAAPVGNPQYFCDDGSTPVSATCADGTDATYVYQDASGNFLVNDSTVAATSTDSTSLLLIAGVLAALWYFGKGL
jgi:hypothetical protein